MWQTIQMCVISSYESCGPPRQEEYMGGGGWWILNRVYVCTKLQSCVWILATLWTIAHQPPLSMGFSRQEYSSRLPCPSPGDLPNPGIQPVSYVSSIGRWGLYHSCHPGSPSKQNQFSSVQLLKQQIKKVKQPWCRKLQTQITERLGWHILWSLEIPNPSTKQGF